MSAINKMRRNFTKHQCEVWSLKEETILHSLGKLMQLFSLSLSRLSTSTKPTHVSELSNATRDLLPGLPALPSN